MWNRHLDAYYAGRDDYFGEDEDEYYPDDDYGGGYSGGYNSAEEDGYDDYYDPLGYLASEPAAPVMMRPPLTILGAGYSGLSGSMATTATR